MFRQDHRSTALSFTCRPLLISAFFTAPFSMSERLVQEG